MDLIQSIQYRRNYVTPARDRAVVLGASCCRLSYLGVCGQCLRQHGLASARGAVQQHTLRRSNTVLHKESKHNRSASHVTVQLAATGTALGGTVRVDPLAWATKGSTDRGVTVHSSGADIVVGQSVWFMASWCMTHLVKHVWMK